MDNSTKVQNIVADPTAMGLTGLALVTAVAASQKLGFTSGTAFIIPWALFFGGILQIVAGKYDYKHNNLFGATVFSVYGYFWLAMCLAWFIKLEVFGLTTANAVDDIQIGFAFVILAVFSIVGTIAASQIHKVLFMDMILISILFINLSIYTFTHTTWAGTLAGYSEALISIVSMYAATATFLNKFFGREILKLGKPIKFK